MLLAASAARADIVPANLGPCEGLPGGAPCETKACNHGVCTVLDLSCPKPAPDCLGCLLLHSRDSNADELCKDDCPKGRVPCVVCAAHDPQADLTSTTNRYQDCVGKKAGDACKTLQCEDGVCAIPPCDAPPCQEYPECVTPATQLDKDTMDRLPAWVASGLTGVLALFAATLLLRKRRGRR